MQPKKPTLKTPKAFAGFLRYHPISGPPALFDAMLKFFSNHHFLEHRVMYKKVSILLIPILAILATAPACAQRIESKRIKVITYNVQFLPGIAGIQNQRKQPAYRAGRIAEEMSKYDIVGLQETFDVKYRKQIITELRNAWDGKLNVVESPTPEGFMTNGGCLILTRLKDSFPMKTGMMLGLRIIGQSTWMNAEE